MEGNPNARYCPCDFCETLVVCENVIGLWLCFWCRPESQKQTPAPAPVQHSVSGELFKTAPLVEERVPLSCLSEVELAEDVDRHTC